MEGIFDKLQTGDIILFHGEHFWFSTVVEYFSGSKYSHIGIILRDPVYLDKKLKGVYLLESGQEDFPDCEDGNIKFGVQISDFKKVYDNYDGTIFWRRLNMQKPISIKKLKEIHSVIHNKPYDELPLDLINAMLHKPNEHDRRLDRFFCSALTAYIYTQLGLLPSDTNWSLMNPKDFGKGFMRELNGGYLEDEVQIK